MLNCLRRKLICEYQINQSIDDCVVFAIDVNFEVAKFHRWKTKRLLML